MPVNRYGQRLPPGTTPGRSTRRKVFRRDPGTYCVWTEVIGDGAKIEGIARVYQGMRTVTATLADTPWAKQEQVIYLEMFDSTVAEEQMLRKLAMASALKELYKRMQARTNGATVNDQTFEGDYPALYDFLTLAEVDGKARELGTVSIFCQDGKFKGSLQDKETKHYCFVSAESFRGLMEAMEGALTNPEHEWRESKPFTPWKGKGKG